MRKLYSIGFFVLTLALVVTLSFVYRMSNQRVKDEAKQELKAKTQTEIETCYYIQEKDGYVIVYESDKKTVYEYTSIPVESLPEETQKLIKKGIKVDSLSQIYGFLENYSS